VSWRATRRGITAARREKRLVLALWLVSLALALAAALPSWLALSDAMELRPGTDVLADALRLGVVADLDELHPGIVAGLVRAGLAAFGLAFFVGLATTGGALDVLTSGHDRPFAYRFGRGAGRFFGRFLRLSLLTFVAAALLVAVTAAPLFALSRYLRRESGSEWLAVLVWLLALAAAGLAVLVALLLQDAARVRVVREDQRRVWPLWRSSLRLVLGHPLKWLRVWSWNALLLLLCFAVYALVAEAIPAGPLLVLLVLLQQAFVIARCGLRVALLNAEIELVGTLSPSDPPLAPPQDELEPPLPVPDTGAPALPA
jgi:hypothetical protein